MSITSLVDIPEDLAAAAAKVEGLPLRLLLFIRAEVTQDQKRKSRHSAQAQEIVKKATKDAEDMLAAGFSREEAMAEFQTLYSEVLNQIAERHA